MMFCRSKIFQKTLLLEFCSAPDAEIAARFPDLSDDARHMLAKRAAKLKGEGLQRCVWRHASNPNVVIKATLVDEGIESTPDLNKAEYEAWREVSTDPELARWFSPVRWISPCGYVLVQDRAAVSSTSKWGYLPRSKFPDRMPGIFNHLDDMHPGNFGFAKGGRLVCIDYPVGSEGMVPAMAEPDAHDMLRVTWLDNNILWLEDDV